MVFNNTNNMNVLCYNFRHQESKRGQKINTGLQFFESSRWRCFFAFSASRRLPCLGLWPYITLISAFITISPSSCSLLKGPLWLHGACWMIQDHLSFSGLLITSVTFPLPCKVTYIHILELGNGHFLWGEVLCVCVGGIFSLSHSFRKWV